MSEGRMHVTVFPPTRRRLFNLKASARKHSLDEVCAMLLDLYDKQDGVTVSTIDINKKQKRKE
jgi:hypothetical protein